MAIPVKLPVFEGPLDLLMHLIEKNKIDIYDIPIVEITDQYMEYVHQMDSDDMDVTSEFLVMAATLLDIKSKMLLPREKDEESGEEEDDPREELVRRLLEYKMYKYLSEELAVCREQAGVRFFREQNLPKEVLTYQPPVNYEELLKGTDLQNLQRVFGEVLRRKKSRQDPIRSGFGRIRREEINIDAKTLYIRAFLKAHPRTDFRALLESRKSREEVIVTFLILLELIKTQKVHILQDSIGGRILVEAASDLPPLPEETGSAPGVEEAAPDYMEQDPVRDDSPAPPADEPALNMTCESAENPEFLSDENGRPEDDPESLSDEDGRPGDDPESLSDEDGRPGDNPESLSDEDGRPGDNPESLSDEDGRSGDCGVYIKEESPAPVSPRSDMPLTAFRRMEIVSSPGPDCSRNLPAPVQAVSSSDGEAPASVFGNYFSPELSHPEGTERRDPVSYPSYPMEAAEAESRDSAPEKAPASLTEKDQISAVPAVPFFPEEKASHSGKTLSPSEENGCPDTAEMTAAPSPQGTPVSPVSQPDSEKREKPAVSRHLWHSTAGCNTIAPVTLPGSPHFNQLQPDPLWRRRRLSRLWSRRFTLKQQ